jgi:hypothetical protein
MPEEGRKKREGRRRMNKETPSLKRRQQVEGAAAATRIDAMAFEKDRMKAELESRRRMAVERLQELEKKVAQIPR